jgi:hypothetical protein
VLPPTPPSSPVLLTHQSFALREKQIFKPMLCSPPFRYTSYTGLPLDTRIVSSSTFSRDVCTRNASSYHMGSWPLSFPSPLAVSSLTIPLQIPECSRSSSWANDRLRGLRRQWAVRLFRVRVEVEELFENIESRDIEVGSGGRATEEYNHCVHAESVW